MATTPTPPAPPAPLEPRMGLDAFAQAVDMRPHLVAALKRWMTEQHQDPDRYYSFHTWQEFVTRLRSHPLT